MYEVQKFLDHPRYKTLTKDHRHFIIDMDRRIWFTFFPFLFWMRPHRMYRVDPLTVPNSIPIKSTYAGTFISVAGIGIIGGILAEITAYLEDYDAQVPLSVNTFALSFIVVVVLCVRYRLRIKHQRTFQSTVSMNEQEFITVRTKTRLRHKVLYISMYIQLVALVFGFSYFFIFYGNVLALFSAGGFFFMMLTLNHKALHTEKVELTLI